MDKRAHNNPPTIREGDVAPFQFEGRNIRIVMKAEEFWFIAADAATELAYRDAHDLTRNLDDDEKDTHRVRTPGGDQDVAVISEAGLYRAIIQRRATKKVEEKLRSRIGRFQRWVFHDVLPSIRKTGAYIAAPRVEEAPQPRRIDKSAREVRLCTDQSVKLAKLAGLDGPHALQAAASRVRHMTGHDMLAEMGLTFLPAPQDEKPLISTQIGERLGDLSARAVNQIFLKNDFLAKDERGEWIVTEKGKAAGGHVIMKERKNSEGVAYQCVWPASIVDTLRGLMAAEAH